MSAVDAGSRGPVPDGPRLIIADDHAPFRTGMRELLETRGFSVVGEARDGDEAVRQTLALAPDVVMMDLHMPGTSGVDATRRLALERPGLPIVMITASTADSDVLEALLAGALGYVLKGAPIETIVGAVRAALEGDSVISRFVAGRLVARVRDMSVSSSARRRAQPQLSGDEIEILRLLSRGLDNPDIAAELRIGADDVRTAVADLLGKLGVANRVEAAVYAVRHGLI
jgi:DNA-binding NarL/FixJ family response regulator